MIDAHVHLWRLDRDECRWPGADLTAIHRDFTIDDLLAEMDAHGMGSAILVQSQEADADTRWLLDIAMRCPRHIAGVVGWVDLMAADAPARIDALRQVGPLLGIRPMVQDRADHWFDDPALVPALSHMADHGLILDALVRPRHLGSLARLAERMPALQIVLDHCGKPDMASLSDWAASMTALAAHPNLACKFSGLLTEVAPGPNVATVRGLFDVAFDAFGPHRLVWGSDWPVLTLAASYGTWRDMAMGLVPQVHHDAVFAGNAARIYRLKVTA